jgi:hypothetical protein
MSVFQNTLSIGITSRPIRLNAILYGYNVCLNLHKDRYSIYLERFSVANSGFLKQILGIIQNLSEVRVNSCTRNTLN